MTVIRHSFTARDTLTFLVGAAFTHLMMALLAPPSLGLNSLHSIVVNNNIPSVAQSHLSEPFAAPPSAPSSPSIDLADSLPETTIVHHAPGWTIFRNAYMTNGTLFLLSSEENRSAFPPFRLMTSTGVRADLFGMDAWQPREEHMSFLSPEEARSRWGGDVEKGRRNRVVSVEGNTVLVNDKQQFIRHFFHFVAELLFGVQAFWHGCFSTPIPSTATIPSLQYFSANFSKHPSSFPVSPVTMHPSAYTFQYSDEESSELQLPKIDRMIFRQLTAKGWRDDPGFDAHVLRAAFPSLTVEVKEDWNDRVEATRLRGKGHGLTKFGSGDSEDDDVEQTNTPDRAFHFPILFVVDRLSSLQNDMGGRTQRVAAPAFEYMRGQGRLRGERVGGWWEPLRSAVIRWAGGPVAEEPKLSAAVLDGLDAKQAKSVLPMPETVVITYISRQGGVRRRLLNGAHDGLVEALVEVCERRGWELNIVQAEKLSRDEQVRIAARTTIMLGVHGNGLTHLVFMPPTRISAVIEIFYPGGFAQDYHWTSRALGMEHFGVWNDTYFTYPNEPQIDLPEGFQGVKIPVHGPTVAKIVEDRVDGRL